MTILLNGEKTEVSENASIASLLEEKKLDPKTVIVELDGEIYKHEDFEKTTFKGGSVVEVLRFVGGG